MVRIGFVFAIAIAGFVPGRGTFAQEAKSQAKAGNPLVTALWFSHRYAKADALTPSKDRELKAILSAGLRGMPVGLSEESALGLFDRATYRRLAGVESRLTLEKMERILREQPLQSREGLYPKIRQHADLLTTQFDMLDERHREGAGELVEWIEKNYRPGRPLEITVICTGNSRRSMMGSSLGNIAAAYYGLPNIRFSSGGTKPSAFNARAIATLKEIGAEIEPTGKEAPRGESGEANPIYLVRHGPKLEYREFSKMYDDANNPQTGFAAILVCSEADAACPTVKGASVRISVPYADPKAYDGASFEAAKYAERRDDIGRFMLNAMMQARRRLEVSNPLKSGGE